MDGNDCDNLAGILRVLVKRAGTHPAVQYKCCLSLTLMQITFSDSEPDTRFKEQSLYL